MWLGYWCAVINKVDDILRRIEDLIDGRQLLSLREQILADCHVLIQELQIRRMQDLEKAAIIVEKFDVNAKTVVGKMMAEQRKADVAAKIRALKE